MDLVLVLTVALVVALAVFLGSKLAWRGSATGDDGEERNVVIEYVIEFSRLQNSATGSIGEGDSVRLAGADGQSLGTVTEIFHEPYTELIYSEGEQSKGVLAELEGYTNMLVTLRSEARHSDSGYYIGDVRMLVGSDAEIMSRGFSGTGFCVSIREVG